MNLDIQTIQFDQPLSGVGPGAGHVFAEAYFPKALNFLRIATGYFSVKGYEIGRAHFSPEVQLKILVGKREGRHVQEAVRQEIHRELLRGDAGGLYNAVVDLVRRIKSGKFQIRDGREMQRSFHCKFYISDSEVLWHGSANFSTNGLLKQAEQVSVSFDVEHITRWVGWFEETSANAKDLLADILEELEQWLRMATPFEAYLKSLYLLFELPEAAYQKGAHLPVYYQLSLIAWSIRAIRNYNGALTVVATGLGKTVIGSEVAARLFRTREIDSVILIVPKVVHSAWVKQLITSRKITTQIFGDRVLFLETSGNGRFQSDLLEEALDNADERTLIIIDEAHIYRNQLKERETVKPALVINRLRKATDNKAKVLLLTGSAYGTSILNLNSLLALLPLQPESGGILPWTVETHKDFAELNPVCVLGIPHVQQMARDRGDIDEQGRSFIDFRGSRKYLPKILKSTIISFKPPIFEEALQAFDGRYFKQKRLVPTSGYDDEAGFIDAVSDSVENNSIKSWLSSPKAFVHCIKQNLATPGEDLQWPISFTVEPGNNQQQNWQQAQLWANNTIPITKEVKRVRPNKKVKGYNAKLKYCQEIRARKLEPLLNTLNGNLQDGKLSSLITNLQERCLQNHSKAIIFVEFHLTAVYLEENLSKIFGKKLRIGSTVCKKKLALKSFLQREDLIHRLCPVANDKPGPGNLDVLICTDADGIGVNMQDADTIINYDLSGGADVLVQRLGRILRPTENPERLPCMLTFLPDLNHGQSLSSKTFRLIKGKVERFRKRHDKSSDILGAPSLSSGQREDISLTGKIDIEKLLYNLDDFSRASKQTSVAEHLCTLEANREMAQKLAIPLCSAMDYNEDLPRLILLLKYKDRYFPVVYKPSTESIESENDLMTLNWLKCGVNEPLAGVSPAYIHQLADKTIACWSMQKGFDVEEIERNVTVYLKPKKLSNSFFKQ